MIDHASTCRCDQAGNKALDEQEAPPPEGGVTAEAIQAWIVWKIAEQLRVEEGEIDVRSSLMSFGLDSIAMFTLTGDLADQLGCDLPANLLWEYPTIEAVARHLAESS